MDMVRGHILCCGGTGCTSSGCDAIIKEMVENADDNVKKELDTLISGGTIEKMIRQRGGKQLESCTLFDIYEGDQIQEGYKSMAYSLVFRASDRTLADTDVTAAMKKIWNGLQSLGIEIRS